MSCSDIGPPPSQRSGDDLPKLLVSDLGLGTPQPEPFRFQRIAGVHGNQNKALEILDCSHGVLLHSAKPE